MKKKCYKCKQEKDQALFWKSHNTYDGLQHSCITCSKERWFKKVTSDPAKRAEYRENEKRRYERDIQKYLWRIAKKRAKLLGREFTIRPEDIKIVDRCPVLDIELKRNRGVMGPDSYSIDRINNSKGYIPGNIAVVSWKFNQLKSNLTFEQVESFYKHFKEAEGR